jgi:hemerythrin-like domain-containing protein
MKATELLQRQHHDLEALLEKLRTAGQGEERTVRQELAASLVAHTIIEEEHFYPAVREALPEEILEAFEEHGLADVQLARLLASRGGDDASEAKLAVLSDLLIRHIRREETDVFRAADRELGDDAQEQLAEKMVIRFRQVMDAGFTKLLQKALEAEVPRTPSRVAAAKKTARRAPRTSAAKKKAAPKARAVPRRAPTKRAVTKRGAAATPRKSPKQARTTRGSAGTTRTRA